MLTYESATELLHLNLEEEAELRILSEAAALRLQWRRQQVGLLQKKLIYWCQNFNKQQFNQII